MVYDEHLLDLARSPLPARADKRLGVATCCLPARMMLLPELALSFQCVEHTMDLY